MRLACEIHECSRHEHVFVLHEDFDIPGPYNKLARQLPPFYEIKDAQLTQTLTEITRDPELARLITDEFINAAKTYQLWRALVQGNLGLSSSAMTAIEQQLPLQELVGVVEVCKGNDVVLGILRRSIEEGNSNLQTIERVRDWTGLLREYCAKLTPLERLVPAISPWRTPDLFLEPDHCTKMSQRLEVIRADQDAQQAACRLSLMTRMEETLTNSPNLCSSNVIFCFALLLTYGFGIRSEHHKDANSTKELTQAAYQLFRDDMERVAPEVSLLGMKGITFQMHEVLESLAQYGFAKHSLTPNGPVQNLCTLCPSVRRAKNWANIFSLVSLIRAGNQDPERLLAGQVQGREKTKKEASASAIQGRSAPLGADRILKFYRDLTKSFEAFESALDELPQITREHLQRKQLSTLMSTAVRIRDLYSKLASSSTQTENTAHVEDLMTFLRPPLFSEQARIGDFTKLAKTSLHLLRDSILPKSGAAEGAC
jgi:hypothetical protein